MRGLLLLLAVHGCGAWLSSVGTRIVFADTLEPVRLRCVNWYGAHQQGFVAGGLDKRSCGDIAASIAAIGANCVRIPVSVELVVKNPVVNRSVVAGLNASECWRDGESTEWTALEVLDCQVEQLTRRDIMVVVNIHNSFAGWVGANERVPQGLWHSARFPMSAWLASLSALALRYRSDPLVVGLDIRNEIHDQDGVVITWGRSDDEDTDWKAATELADRAIAESNPEMLVIVSGLSRGYDLRAMQDLRNDRSKYVFTTHVYVFSLWFTHVDWPLVLMLSLLFVACNVAGMAALRHRQQTERTYIGVEKHRRCWAYVLVGAVLPPVYVVAVSLVWAEQATEAGCSSIADDAAWSLLVGVLGLLAVAGAWCALAMHENEVNHARLLTSLCGWNVCLGLFQVGLSVFYQTPLAVAWDLRRWDSRTIPVWVGEFGTVVGDRSAAWGLLLSHVKAMDFAYWPLNGCMDRFGWTQRDTFGLLGCDWATVRDAPWTARIFEDGI